jgi:ribulose-phosphate 3-epimerase
MLLSPSSLAADLADLGAAAEVCQRGGADLIHVDVMDGHFVPNLTIGVPVIEALKARTNLPLDVHLMVSNPDRLLDEYLAAGADWVSVHFEVTTHLDRTLNRIRAAGARAGVALNPTTSIDLLREALPVLDFVLLMSVNPGFAGQSFLPYVVEKARRLHEMAEEAETELVLAMDGGIGKENIRWVVEAGVGLCVAGSAIFAQEDPVVAMQELRRRAEVAEG